MKPGSFVFAAFATAVVAAGCAGSPTAYNPPPRVDDASRLVSCKLPPQIRRLGQHATYLAAARPRARWPAPSTGCAAGAR